MGYFLLEFVVIVDCLVFFLICKGIVWGRWVFFD